MKRSADIAYVLSVFPALTETFVAREIQELERRGFSVLVAPLKPRPDTVGKEEHPEAAVLYRSLASPSVMSAALLEFLRAPLAVSGTVIMVMGKLAARPQRALKFLAAVPKALYLTRCFRAASIKHVHAHWATVPTTCALLICRLLHIPFSFSAHAWDIFVEGNELLLREKIAAADRVFVCTNYGKNRLLQFGPDHKIEVAYHGIEIDRYHYTENAQQPPMILAGASLTAQKGIDVLIEAIARIEDRDFTVQIIGDGPERSAIEQRIGELNLGDRITLVGRKPHREVLAMMQRACIFCMPSRLAGQGFTDGLPNVVGEAMASGAAIVASRFSGIPELVEHEQSGLLVPPEDPEALASAITRLLDDTELAMQLARSGRKVVEQKFDLERNLQPMASYFEAQLYESKSEHS